MHRFVIEPAINSPDAVAVIDASSGLTTTRQELVRGVQAVARVLVSRGVMPEQRILMCCVDRPSFLMWCWGAMWLGAVPVPVSTMLTEKDYKFLIEDSRAVGVAFSEEFEEVITEIVVSSNISSATEFVVPIQCVEKPSKRLSYPS